MDDLRECIMGLTIEANRLMLEDGRFCTLHQIDNRDYLEDLVNRAGESETVIDNYDPDSIDQSIELLINHIENH